MRVKRILLAILLPALAGGLAASALSATAPRHSFCQALAYAARGSYEEIKQAYALSAELGSERIAEIARDTIYARFKQKLQEAPETAKVHAAQRDWQEVGVNDFLTSPDHSGPTYERLAYARCFGR